MSTLGSFWKHGFLSTLVTKFSKVINCPAPSNDVNDEIRSELENVAKNLNVNYTPVGIEKLLNLEEEDNVLEDTSVEGLVEEDISAKHSG